MDPLLPLLQNPSAREAPMRKAKHPPHAMHCRQSSPSLTIANRPMLCTTVHLMHPPSCNALQIKHPTLMIANHMVLAQAPCCCSFAALPHPPASARLEG
ncbi:hypothetical protein DUNSADRAFT_13156 [Dunaliella salina]|uniref:Encoded protein n=1 Tax=Dunaliella salina TaxID=3046 RepID=A0ABQ7G9Y9_DUNSA|nr:hypothetical protein DUNSADRAFT_13156 [Dunaliella salina]|eukprot:KAF5831421.1 hypothetical protein DUNSADRAFT_13156 [Dunaliella salina]